MGSERYSRPNVMMLGLALGLASLLFDLLSQLPLVNAVSLIHLLFFYIIIWLSGALVIHGLWLAAEKLSKRIHPGFLLSISLFFGLMWLNIAHWLNRKVFKLFWLRKLTLFGMRIPAGALSSKVWLSNFLLLAGFAGLWAAVVFLAGARLSKQARSRLDCWTYPLLLFSILFPIALFKNHLILWGSYSIAGLAWKITFVITLSLGIGRGTALLESHVNKIPHYALPIVLLVLLALFFLVGSPTSRALTAKEFHEAGLFIGLFRGLTDRDGDGFSTLIGLPDCDDSRPEINALALDIPGNGIDEDCLGGDATTVQLPDQGPGCTLPLCGKKQNMLFLIIDAANVEHFGFSGYGRETTPFIDSIAENGIIFEQAFAPSSWTPTSVATMLTGLSPATHQIYYLRDDALEEGIPTLPQLLGDVGYQTTGFMALDPAITSRYMGFYASFDHFDDSFRYEPGGLPYLRGEVLVDKMIAWLGDRDPDSPFFILAHFDDLHLPYHPPEPYDTMFGSAVGKINYDPDSMMDADLEYMVQMYDGSLRYVDDQFKRLFGWLDENGLGDTIIILTADHGEEFMQHGGVAHAKTLYAESIHVPLILRIPDTEPQRIANVVGLIDILPTLLDYTGIPPPVTEGISLIPPLTQPGEHNHEYSLEVRNRAFGPKYVLFGTLDWPHKYLLNVETGQEELFDLKSDPQERMNIITSSPEAAGEMRSLTSSLRTMQLMLHEDLIGGEST